MSDNSLKLYIYIHASLLVSKFKGEYIKLLKFRDHLRWIINPKR